MQEVIVLLAPFLMVCFIVWTKHQRKMTALQMQLGAEDSAAAEAYARLEERVRVLERIVTDRGYNLAEQIEALRENTPQVQPRDTTPAQ